MGDVVGGSHGEWFGTELNEPLCMMQAKFQHHGCLRYRAPPHLPASSTKAQSSSVPAPSQSLSSFSRAECRLAGLSMSDPDADADATTSSPEPHHHQPPTVAPFAPATAPNSSSAAAFSSPSSTRALHHQVHRKSPLLVATPPPVTRALAQAYPWLRTFNYAAGLLTWSTKDPWESFLLVSVFWFVALYGSFLLRWVGNLCAVAVIAASMLLRRRLRTGKWARGGGVQLGGGF